MKGHSVFLWNEMYLFRLTAGMPTNKRNFEFLWLNRKTLKSPTLAQIVTHLQFFFWLFSEKKGKRGIVTGEKKNGRRPLKSVQPFGTSRNNVNFTKHFEQVCGKRNIKIL